MPQHQATYLALKNLYVHLPHCAALGLRFEHEHGRIPTLSIDWREDLIGNSDSRVLHGGAVTTLIDVVGAVAVAAHLPEIEALATLDLRIDYLHPAPPAERVFATAECYRLSGQVAFVRTVCYARHAEDPFALGTATYMRTPLPAHLKGAVV
ncbi:MAG: PaaI family thioesterase [Neisseria sp.]|nr:PaaI family thioesterase [Neisseria sp.]